MPTLLEALEATPSITRALRLGDELGDAAALSDDPAGCALLLERTVVDSLERGDALTALAAIHAIGRIADDRSDAVLIRLVREADRPIAGHAAWVLGGRTPDLDVVDDLIELVVEGGFEAMLAQRTLAQWSPWAGGPIADRLRQRIGLFVRDELGLDVLADADGPVGRLLDTREAGVRAAQPLDGPRPRPGPVTVIQPFLHARLDAAGSRLGAGDAGGIASLLRSLGADLARHPAVRDVITVTRANPVWDRSASDGGAITWEDGTEILAPGHRLVRVRYGAPVDIPLADAWIHRIAIERELTRLAHTLSGPVVWHLRMADVGTLAAATVARRFGHRIVFTVAPDPHAVIASHQHSGRLDRAGFGAADATEHLWFRARMVERLAGPSRSLWRGPDDGGSTVQRTGEAHGAQADRLVALPRPHLAADLHELLGIDVDDPSGGVAVIPEGVDVGALDRADARRHIATAPAPAVAAVLDALPPHRRDRAWLLTVGRLHPLKGPHRLVEAWAGSPGLRERFNLVIVGGDLDDPSPTEQATCALVHDAASAAGADSRGLVLAGQVPPDGVADLLTHAAAIDGVYVAASDKEEFGLAIVEALGAGLVVVAPRAGGASTYIEQGATGVVTDTRSVPAVRLAIIEAAAMAGDPRRRRRAKAFVRAELSVATMAERLGDLYGSLAGPSTTTSALVSTRR